MRSAGKVRPRGAGLRKTQTLIVAVLGLSLLAPQLQGVTASAEVDGSDFRVYSEDSQSPQFHGLAGMDLSAEDSAASEPPVALPTDDPDSGSPSAPGKSDPGQSAPETPSLDPPVDPVDAEPEAELPSVDEPDPSVSLPEAPYPLEEVVPAFEAGPGAYEISKVSWNQMSAKQVCVDVSVKGNGGKVQGWYLTMNAATVPLNHDFNRSSYQFPTWGYGFEGDFVGSKIKIVGHNHSQWNDFSTLTGGQERTLRLCNWNAPKPPATHQVELTELSKSPGEWSWNARYRVSAPEVEFYTSWKVRVDLSEVNRGYRGSAPIHSEPGPADLKITHIQGDIYEVEGIGWPNMGVRSGHSIEFRIGR